MALGPSVYLVTAWFDSAFNNTSFAVAQAYMKLHTADPGASGATAAGAETSRKSVSMGAPSSGGGIVTISNDAVVEWTGITGSEDATHYSLWDTVGPAGGNFLGSGAITANAYVAGDTLRFAVGDIDISLPVAA